ncbi:MAG: lasso peptide biosynthesis B2 protein [Caulobacteraceae bacterium]|nr:lasso peptide biosynthesis B2 protein [Caulobacteraceae bacterium]
MIFLKAGVHAAVIDTALVILDLEADHYFCLPNGGETLVRRPDGGAEVLRGPARDTLEAAGLLQAEAPPLVRTLPAKPSRTAIYDPAEVSWRDLLAGLAATLDVRKIKPGSGIAAYLSEPSLRPSPEPKVLRAARAFWRLQPWLPIEGECLVRSALLVRALHRQGLEAQWVFGVRLFPFMAHCWVQAGDTCLNDDVERLSAYQPLLCR